MYADLKYIALVTALHCPNVRPSTSAFKRDDSIYKSSMCCQSVVVAAKHFPLAYCLWTAEHFFTKFCMNKCQIMQSEYRFWGPLFSLRIQYSTAVAVSVDFGWNSWRGAVSEKPLCDSQNLLVFPLIEHLANHIYLIFCFASYKDFILIDYVTEVTF